jgi:ATP-dependent protease HslVU (ClpYQ) peptidase subunit
MTCIVGVIHKGKTYIGADSAGVAGLDITIRKDSKVFKVGEFVIGCCGSFRMINLLKFSLNPPKVYHDDDIYKYMCTEFVNAVRNCFKNGGFLKIDSNVESGGFFLVGYKDRLFNVQNDYQVGECEKPYDAMGCGEPFALGALDVLPKEMKPEDKIKKALEIAAYRSGGVRPPFIIEST